MRENNHEFYIKLWGKNKLVTFLHKSRGCLGL